MRWASRAIGEICEVVSGATPKSGNQAFWDGDVPWVTPKDLSNLEGKILSDTPRKITDAGFKSCSTRMLPKQSVLFSSRAPIGLVALNSIPVCTNQGFKSLVPKMDLVSPDFLYWWLKLNRASIERLGRGATFKEVSKKIVEEIQVPLPPLPEQKRIAAILNKADELRAKRREAIAEMDKLVRATFLDMFGDPVTNPRKLSQSSLKDVFQFTTGKLDSNAAVEGGKYPFFTCAKENFAIDEYAFDCEALLLAGNNANADYSVKHFKGKFNAYQRTYVISVDKAKLTYEYARTALEFMLADLKRYSKGSNTKYLTLSILNRMPILLPSLDEQHRFSQRKNAIYRQVSVCRNHENSLNSLFQSLQSRAFNGEL